MASLNSIRARTSIRTYDGTPLTAHEKEELRASFDEAGTGPFGGRPRFILAARDQVEDEFAKNSGTRGGFASGRVKVGTYGMIVGPRAFIAGVIARRPFACVDFGYCLEKVVLRATELGLGSCWIGGAFDRGAIAKALDAGKDEFVPATSPVGHAAKRRSIQDRFVRGRGSPRKEPSELFFEADASGRLGPLLAAGDWTEVLEAVRLAPSARNMQPWRLVLDRRSGEALHLVMHEDRFYNNLLGDVKLQELDMGIAMCHVEVAAGELDIKGAWKRLEPDPILLEEPRHYVSSFVRG
jgi:nitroreductase